MLPENSLFYNALERDTEISFYRIRLLTWGAVYNTFNGNEFSLLNPRTLSRHGECLKAARYSPEANFYIAIISNRRLRDEV